MDTTNTNINNMKGTDMEEISLEQLGTLFQKHNENRRSKYNVDEMVEHFMTFETDGEISIPYIQLIPVSGGPVPEVKMEFSRLSSSKENLRGDIIRLLDDPMVSDFPMFSKWRIKSEQT